MKIKKAQYIEGYKIALTFDDRNSKTIDLFQFLKKANNPMTYQFLDVEKFKKFRIESGHLIWPRYEMMLSAESLRQWNEKPVKDLV